MLPSRLFSFGLVAAVLISSARAETFLVDAAGAPDADFTAMQPAIDAAAPGDTIMVRDGDYDGFVLDRPLTVIAEQVGARFADTTVVRDIPAGTTASLTGFFLEFLVIEDCPGSVIGTILAIGPPDVLVGVPGVFALDIEDAADVRFRASSCVPHFGTGHNGIRVARSRFEAEAISFDGARGTPGIAERPHGGDGGVGILVGNGGFVHIANGRVRGGWGGNALFSPEGTEWSGGDGNEAFVVEAGGHLQFTGNILSEILGGGAGSGSLSQSGPVFNCPLQGNPGSAVRVNSGGTARISQDIQIIGGFSGCTEDGAPIIADGTVELVTPDLNIHYEGAIPQIGLGASFVVSEPAGSLVTLLVGVTPLNMSFPKWKANPLLVDPLFTTPIVVVPAPGEFGLPVSIPFGTPPGIVLVVQVASLRTNGDFFLSNSTGITTLLPQEMPCDPVPCNPTK